MPGSIDKRTAEHVPRRIDFKALLGGDDEVFLRAAYWQLLGRLPDPSGFSQYLERLRGGASRIEILGDIRFSPEGQTVGRKAAGLRWRHAWHVLVQKRFKRRFSKLIRAAPPDAARSGGLTGAAVAGASGEVGQAWLDGVLAFNDIDFVIAAYRRNLGREPDPSGLRSYLTRLQAGEARAGVLESILVSPEARARIAGRVELPWPTSVRGAVDRAPSVAVLLRETGAAAPGRAEPSLGEAIPADVSGVHSQLLPVVRDWSRGSRRVSRLDG